MILSPVVLLSLLIFFWPLLFDLSPKPYFCMELLNGQWPAIKIQNPIKYFLERLAESVKVN